MAKSKVPAKKTANKKKAVKLPAKSSPKTTVKKAVAVAKPKTKKALPKPKVSAKPPIKKKPPVPEALSSEPENVAVAEIPAVVEKPAKVVKPRAPRKVKDPFAEDPKASKHFLALLEATPSKNKEGSMLVELELAMKKHLVTEKGKESEETLALVRAKIDHHGLTGGGILAMMRNLQQAIKLRPGFYRALQNIEGDYNVSAMGTV